MPRLAWTLLALLSCSKSQTTGVLLTLQLEAPSVDRVTVSGSLQSAEAFPPRALDIPVGSAGEETLAILMPSSAAEKTLSVVVTATGASGRGETQLVLGEMIDLVVVVRPTTTSTMRADAGVSDAGERDAGAPDALIDRGLVVRYPLNDAPSGQDPMQVLDAAPNPLHLPLTYVGAAPEFVTTQQRSGLRWRMPGLDGRASVLVDGTKVQTMLDGSTEATIEAVVNLQDATSEHSRLVHIGAGESPGNLSLQILANGRAYFYVNDDAGTTAQWQTDWLGGARKLITLVFDSNHPTSTERVRLFVDSGRVDPSSFTEVPIGRTLTILDGRHLVIGNREIGERSPQGTIYYAAVYNVAFDDAEVMSNQMVLRREDD